MTTRSKRLGVLAPLLGLLACSRPTLEIGNAGQAGHGPQAGNAGQANQGGAGALASGGTGNPAAGSGGVEPSASGGASGVSSLSGPLSIAIGDSNGCALRAGLVWCWGSNHYGVLGQTPDALSSPAPVQIAGLSRVVEIQAGGSHVCALSDDGKVYCWGSNQLGEVGATSASKMTCRVVVLDVGPRDEPCQPTPTEVPLDEAAVGLALGSQTSCALLASGKVTCWGSVEGLSDWFASLNGVTKLQLGVDGACAVTATGVVACSNDDALGRLNGATNASDIALSQAFDHHLACLIDTAGGVRCWGDNESGQRGIGSDAPETPENAQTRAIATGAVSMSLGQGTACARLEDGTLLCWGNNDGGAVGTPANLSPRCGASHCEVTPRPVEGLPPARQLASGAFATCIATLGAEVWCWPTQGPFPIAGNAGRVRGPWEDLGSSCARAERAIDERLANAYATLNSYCLTKYDCAEIPLQSDCYSACSSGPITKTDAGLIQAAFDAANAALCLPNVACSVSRPSCPAPQGELDCQSNRCVRFDAVATGCNSACECQIPQPFADSVACAGVDLEFQAAYPCSACGGATVHFLLYNRGQSDFHGLVTLEASALPGETPTTVPPPVSAMLDIPAGSGDASLSMDFHDQPGEVRVRLSAAGDCDASDDETIADIAQFGKCP